MSSVATGHTRAMLQRPAPGGADASTATYTLEIGALAEGRGED